MAVYASTVFSGALLLFLVQPLIGKYILPWFGGTAGVWTVCMLFFQVLLLAGYGYADLITRSLSLVVQARFHIALLALVVMSLPITPADTWRPSSGDSPTLHILLLLAANIGPAYFALSTTGPLLQRWYSVLHPGRSPYRFYALSNAGSLLALLAYPFVIEPVLSRRTQAELWSWAMVVFAGICGYCAFQTQRQARLPPSAPPGEAAMADSQPPTRLDYALWLALPTTASAMLLVTTSKLCQELAVIPFLWVLPLSLYLLSFILCFDSPRWYRRIPFGAALLVCIAEYDAISLKLLSLPVGIAAYGAILFVVCMVCHGELHRLRPHPRYLTTFYLMVAAGGALGGVIVALIAPLIFTHYEEFEVGIMGCAVLALLVHYFDKTSPLHRGRPRLSWACLLLAYLGMAFLLAENVHEKRRHHILATRDFYGALYITHSTSDASRRAVHTLVSGNTRHGIQVMTGALKREPTAYFGKETGVGLALLNFPRSPGIHIGTVGLGVGTLAAYGQPGDRLRFYEIDRRVVELAEGHFTYLADARAPVSVVLGDARFSLEREAPQEFDVLVLDAFSSDAIPVHLLTREAFDVYLRHLQPDGVIAVHISNRHVDLEPVLVALGHHFGLTTLRIENSRDMERWWVFPSLWVLMTRNSEFLASAAIRDAARVLDERSVDPILWTDEYTSVFRVLK